MSISVSSTVSIVLVNTTHRATINVSDAGGLPVDPYSLTLSVQTIGGSVLFTDTWSSGATPARIVKSGVGAFYVDFGNQTPNNETNGPGEWLFDWAVQQTNGGTIDHSLNKVKVISAIEASMLPEFRLLIDKTQKMVDTTNQCYLGYTDAQLISYLEGGLQHINAYQPSVLFSIDTFPLDFKQVLLDAGLITGVMSQQLFAIDTDIPNYNDQGTSFVISHQPQLAAFLNQVTQRLDKIIPMMKLQMITSGSVHVQMGANFRLAQLMSAAPSGSLFRGVFFKG